MTEPEKLEKPLDKQDIEFESEDERLIGLLFEVDKSGPKVLILGGGANIPIKKGYYPAWQEVMAKDGINSLSFDYRGVGSSGGDIKETSLDSRLEDARQAANLLNERLPTGKLFIAGISMGAPIAMRLANEVQTDGVILISPAAYSKKARSAKYGEEFSETIRKEGSWRDSPDFEELRNFQGKVLLAYGEEDEVIPAEILEEYRRTAENNGKVLKFKGAGHRFMRLEGSASQSAREHLYSQITNLILMPSRTD